ncbi:uncharacterized protein RHO25_008922 [Cercospora beticola]|uniref:C2H2-type domain-containing protein n=1 Tax=Cercospora beticola TaxID=122368 RepID=A0ABZ0NXU8_CERBT|nr:hypothetical protein RHO25_008922 [Cercospora beticola]CAK1356907.1 unnamed protein product [Cercospora beticola]
MAQQCKYCSKRFAHGPARRSHERAHEVRSNFRTDTLFTNRSSRAGVSSPVAGSEATPTTPKQKGVTVSHHSGVPVTPAGEPAGSARIAKHHTRYAVKIMEGVYYGLPATLPARTPERIESIIKITKISFSVNRRTINYCTLREGYTIIFESEIGEHGSWVLSAPGDISKCTRVSEPPLYRMTDFKYGALHKPDGAGGTGGIRATYPYNRAQQRQQNMVLHGTGGAMPQTSEWNPAGQQPTISAHGKLDDGSDSTDRILWNLATLLEQHEHMKEEDEQRQRKSREAPLRHHRNV